MWSGGFFLLAIDEIDNHLRNIATRCTNFYYHTVPNYHTRIATVLLLVLPGTLTRRTGRTRAFFS